MRRCRITFPTQRIILRKTLLYKVILISHYFDDVKTFAHNRHCNQNVSTTVVSTTINPPWIRGICKLITEWAGYNCPTTNPYLHAHMLLSARFFKRHIQTDNFVISVYTHVNFQKNILFCNSRLWLEHFVKIRTGTGSTATITES